MLDCGRLALAGPDSGEFPASHIDSLPGCKHNSRSPDCRQRQLGRGGRVVECTGLENQQGFVALRGFESHPLRQQKKMAPSRGHFFSTRRVWLRMRTLFDQRGSAAASWRVDREAADSLIREANWTPKAPFRARIALRRFESIPPSPPMSQGKDSGRFS